MINTRINYQKKWLLASNKIEIYLFLKKVKLLDRKVNLLDGMTAEGEFTRLLDRMVNLLDRMVNFSMADWNISVFLNSIFKFIFNWKRHEQLNLLDGMTAEGHHSRFRSATLYTKHTSTHASLDLNHDNHIIQSLQDCDITRVASRTLKLFGCPADTKKNWNLSLKKNWNLSLKKKARPAKFARWDDGGRS
jgi:hypothetical protein